MNVNFLEIGALAAALVGTAVTVFGNLKYYQSR